MLRLALVILLVIVFAAGATLGLSNGAYVSFHYIFGSVEIRLAVLVVLSFGLGLLLTLAVSALRMLGLHRELRRLRRQLRDAETELKNLRNLPAGGGVVALAPRPPARP